jgi:hypothetical protein
LRMSVCRLGQEVIVRPRSTSHGGEDEGAGRRVHERLAAELDVPQPRIRVRVLLCDDQAFGVN